MATTALPTHKEVRYDRQLRLWGDHGQEKLEKSHICLLNVTATGTEILKSLVLPGAGEFTIIDGERVSGRDVGSNFFLTQDSIGKSRAETTCQLLKELNPQVKGHFVNETPEQLLKNNITKLGDFSVVIGTGLTLQTAQQVAEYLWARKVPFICVKTYGLLGYLRIAVREHTVVESHQENAFPDLRLDRPFSEIQAFCDEIELKSLTHEKHSHTPYLILLMKALAEWRKQSGLLFPATYAHKKEIKKILMDMRMPDEKGRLDEENVVEAVNAVNRAFQRTEIPSHVQSILSDPRCQTGESEMNSNFWLLCAGLKHFIDAQGEGAVLPLQGSLPDMTSDSVRFVQLQEIYRYKAQSDAALVHAHVLKLLAAQGLATDRITLEDTELFCKNSRFIHVLSGRPLKDETPSNEYHTLKVRQALESTDESIKSLASWYILLRAAERFCASKGRYPGTNGVPVKLDDKDVETRVKSLGEELGMTKAVTDTVTSDMVTEMCRYGATEIHAMAALMGGIAAQEVIKLLTRQYIPVNNTLLFDGHKDRAVAFEF